MICNRIIYARSKVNGARLPVGIQREAPIGTYRTPTHHMIHEIRDVATLKKVFLSNCRISNLSPCAAIHCTPSRERVWDCLSRDRIHQRSLSSKCIWKLDAIFASILQVGMHVMYAHPKGLLWVAKELCFRSFGPDTFPATKVASVGTTLKHTAAPKLFLADEFSTCRRQVLKNISMHTGLIN